METYDKPADDEWRTLMTASNAGHEPSEPQIMERNAQPYVAIRAFVTMQTLGTVLPGLHPQVLAWLSARGIPPVGAPFWKYNVVDMDRQLEVEVGFPVAVEMDGDDQVLAGVLPAGKYATLWHTGHPDRLYDATGRLLSWAADQGLAFEIARDSDGERWGARLEIYETDPAVEPDMNKWVTELAFLLAG